MDTYGKRHLAGGHVQSIVILCPAEPLWIGKLCISVISRQYRRSEFAAHRLHDKPAFSYAPCHTYDARRRCLSGRL